MKTIVCLLFVAVAVHSTGDMAVEKAFADNEIAPQLIPVAPQKLVTVSLN